MADGSRGATNTNVLLVVIAVLLLLLVLYFTGVIAPRDEEAEFRIETPEGDATIDVD
jgi:uncharacterized protein YpmS